MNQASIFSTIHWSVTDLTRRIREQLETDEMLQDVWVEGEISNLSRPGSGHVYFTLKDASASLRCVMWKGEALRLKLQIKDGMAVEAHGRISVYDAGGQYQLYTDQIRAIGEGALYQEFLRLKGTTRKGRRIRTGTKATDPRFSTSYRSYHIRKRCRLARYPQYITKAPTSRHGHPGSFPSPGGRGSDRLDTSPGFRQRT